MTPAEGLHYCEHVFGDKVNIDGDASIIATVTALCFELGRVTVQCCWFANGDPKQLWVEAWRLTDAGR